MPNDTDTRKLPLAWASAAPSGEALDVVFGGVGWWCTGGLALLVWTGVALLLTSG
jgi:hypothetical protein